MEWDDLKEGMIIRWKPYFAKDFDPIIIILGVNLNVYGKICFDTQILSGTSYGAFDYCKLLTSCQSLMGYTKMYRYNFEKNKDQITISEPSDMKYIERRLKNHIASYKIEYDRQKGWGETLLRRAEKFYDTKNTVS